MKTNLRQKRLIRKKRIAAKVLGTSARPRVAVFRSNRQLYVQIIDDQKRTTLVGMTDMHLMQKEKNKIKRAQLLGSDVAQKAKELKIKQVVFDRSGYRYHGRVKAIADSLRSGGLSF